MQEFIIQKNDAGQRLDKFLQKALPHLPVSMLYKALRTKNIKCNKKRAEGAQRLQCGDVIACYLPQDCFAPAAYAYDFLRASGTLDVLFEDAHVLLLDKPAGLLSHSNPDAYCDTLLGRVQRYLFEKGEYDPAGELSFAPALVNRIDRNTRGIVIAAKTAAALRILNEKLKNRELRKYYLCAVHGLPKQGEPLRDDWRQLHCYLLKNEAKNTARIFQNPCAGAKECFTNYRVAAQKNGLSLLEIELLTGRTHQIRAQFAAIGHALVGDGKYAPRALYQKCGYTSQLLCSHRLVFDFLTPADELEYLNQLDIRVKNIQFTENLFHLKY